MEYAEKLNEKLKRGETVYGTHTFCGTPMFTEAVSMLDYDIVWIDMEHTALGAGDVLQNLIAAKAGGAASWVRISQNDPICAKPIIDMGPDGIIFPNIRSYEEALLAVKSCDYPPAGIRGYGPLRALQYGAIKQMDYLTKEYKKMSIVLQIEDINMVNELEKICSIEEIDAFIVGPNDLSASIGRIGDITHPELLAIYEKISGILNRKGNVFGVSTLYDYDFIKLWLDYRARLIFVGTDVGFIYEGAKNMLKDLRSVKPSKDKEKSVTIPVYAG